MHKKKHKQIKSLIKEKCYRFWNNDKEYICSIIAPVSIPDYKLKEVFTKTFVGAKDLASISKTTVFMHLSNNIEYTVKPVKELV